MSSHLDNARKELTAQRRLVSQDITALTRQLKKIDQALEHLAPISNNGTRNVIERKMPTRAETQRRRDVARQYVKDARNGHVFTAHDLVEATGEPEDLVNSYRHLLSIMEKDREVEVAIPGIRGRRVVAYRKPLGK